MKPSPVLVFGGVAWLALGGATGAQISPPDPDEMAQRIVSESARVAEGDVVLIRGHARDQELMEDLAIRARALGAFPLVQYTSDHLIQGLVDQVDERFDNQLNALDARMAGFITCLIQIDATDNPSLLNHVPPKRLAELAKSDAAAADLFRRAGVRTVLIGNGLYPTAATANQYAITQTELAGIFSKAAAAPESELSALGDLTALALSSGSEVRITNPNGTDLKLKLSGKLAVVDDGTIREQDARDEARRPRTTQVRLPAGEVMAGPAPNSAQGRVVVDSLTYRGREVTGLTAVFKNGRVANLYSRSGGEAVRSLYDALGPGKELLAYVDVGVNPEVHDPAGTKLNAPMPKGMVTVWLGSNSRIGGDNAAPFELALYVPGSTLLVDGKPLVESGRLVLPTSPLPVEESEQAGPPEPAADAQPKFFGPEPLGPETHSGDAAKTLVPRSRPAGAP